MDFLLLATHATLIHNRPYICFLSQAYRFSAKRSVSLICNGHYPEILVLNPDTLDVIYSLVARIHPDWVNALCCIKPIKKTGTKSIQLLS